MILGRNQSGRGPGGIFLVPESLSPISNQLGFVGLKAALDPILSSGQIWSFLIVESCSRRGAGPEGCLSSSELVWEREVNWYKGGFSLPAFVLSPKTMSRVTRRTSWMAHGRLVPFPRSSKLFFRVWGCQSLRFCFWADIWLTKTTERLRKEPTQGHDKTQQLAKTQNTSQEDWTPLWGTLRNKVTREKLTLR